MIEKYPAIIVLLFDSANWNRLTYQVECYQEKKTSSPLSLKPLQNKFKNTIFHLETWIMITNLSIVEIPDLFLVQCRKNQMLYWPSRSCSSKNNISFFSQALQIATVSINSKTAKTMHFGHIYNGHAILWATLQSIEIWIDISYNEILYFVLYNIIFYIDTTQYCISIAWFDKIILYHIILIAVFDFNMMI